MHAPTYHRKKQWLSTTWRTWSLAKRNVSITFDLFLFIVIKSSDVQVLFAPLYKGLSIEAFLAEAKKYPGTMDYLPDPRDMHRIPRQFIVNVVHTIIGQPIKDLVKASIKTRNDQVAENRHLMIELDPEIA